VIGGDGAILPHLNLSVVDATDSKGEAIHQTLMAKKMARLDELPDFRPFKFRIQAFTNGFLEEVSFWVLSGIRNGSVDLGFLFGIVGKGRLPGRCYSHEEGVWCLSASYACDPCGACPTLFLTDVGDL
jgi:hypothetical protein